LVLNSKIEDSQAAAGMGRNNVRVATTATRQPRNRLSYTPAALYAQGAMKPSPDNNQRNKHAYRIG